MQNTSRIIGKYKGEKNGTLLLVTAGVHGNEPSGVNALKNVFSQLEKSNAKIKGTFIGVVGNLKSLQKNERFIDEDLNRTWTKENLEKEQASSSEQMEMKEIISILENYSNQDFPDKYFIDCHSTSSDSLPFISVQVVGKNDEFAQKFPTYIVRGFSDIVNGSIDKYFSLQGLTGFTFEAGQHEATTTQTNHEAIVWLALKNVCGLDLNSLSVYPESVENLTGEDSPEQQTFQIIYRHGIEETDNFVMEPDFKNF
ncbi:MAG TPA: succinylglutamate desuccinylase/aspartoacylase family protein, partial [Salinimicrobium sp.]|nr:succinylglutamate desuccinylase/aspartoacylase family protein [Salinimicrobium sp.]